MLFRSGSELMIYGTVREASLVAVRRTDYLNAQVDYGLRNGKKVDAVGWAGRMVFNAAAERLELSRYQVRCTTVPLLLVSRY